MNILHVCADPNDAEQSVAKQIAVAFFQKLTALQPECEINNVDLYENPPPYLSAAGHRGVWYPVLIDGYQATDEDREATAYGWTQSELFNAANVLAITTPMWNGSTPAILKAWIDQLIAPGKTFDYDHKTVKPLHHIDRLLLFVSSDETFKEGDPRDNLTPQLTSIFQALGIQEMSVAWADGQNPVWHADSEPRKDLAIEAAEDLAEEIAELMPAVT